MKCASIFEDNEDCQPTAKLIKLNFDIIHKYFNGMIMTAADLRMKLLGIFTQCTFYFLLSFGNFDEVKKIRYFSLTF